MLVESEPEITVDDDGKDEEGVEGEAFATATVATWAGVGERVVDLLTGMGEVTPAVADSAGSGLVLPVGSGGANPVDWSNPVDWFKSSISKEEVSSSWRATYRYDPFALVRPRGSCS